MLHRRHFISQLAMLFLTVKTSSAYALMPTENELAKNSDTNKARLTTAQALAFRQWVQRIVQQQLNLGPTPRWKQRDCAGLVRFASAEALRVHDNAWLKANGFLGKKLPPELNLSAEQLLALRHTWLRADGSYGAFVGALELVQNNMQLVGRDIAQVQVADILLFDQGQAQHLMIWMGQYLAYHTGTVTAGDNGLRAYPLSKLMSWQDTRWQPQVDNPNFVGIFRLYFLSGI